MVKKFIKHSWIILLLFNGLNVDGQNYILDYFNASEANKEVLLKWAISKGETCNGIVVTRSTDSLNFQPIGSIEGVCGSAEFQLPYNFTDQFPLKNTKAFYRLELGVSDFSNIISFEFIDKNEDGYQVRPQPMVNRGVIFFENTEHDVYELYVFNFSGQLIHQNSSREESFTLNTDKWSGGLYAFILQNGSKKIKGKLIVAK